jgi:para-nitrobenzyl esterase
MNRREVLQMSTGLALATTLSGTLATAMSGTAHAERIASSTTAVVKTTNGPVRGLVEEGVQTFCGLRYGAPPVGPLRFMAPRKPQPWTQTAEALRYGPSAMQLSSGGSAVSFPGTVGPALGQLMTSFEDIVRQSEDCLFLNVWTPQLGTAKPRPVMVWFHGGGFNYGSGSWPTYNGHNLAKHHDVVVVTVNHRLNIFGYLYLDQNGGGPGSGNAGQLDLIAALEWVRDNIEQFGGDPSRVTMFGQSGGGAKVSTLLAMPAAKGLVHRGIIQSGPGLRGESLDSAAAHTAAVLAMLQVKDAQGLRDVPADKLLAAASRDNSGSALRWRPVVDNAVLPANPFDPTAPAQSADIPIIIGCTKDEQTLYNVGQAWWGKLSEAELVSKLQAQFGAKTESLLAAFRQLRPQDSPSYLYTDVTSTNAFIGSVTLAERKAQQPAPVYMYVWEWGAPVDAGIMRAPHTIELPFVFDNVELGPILLGNAATTQRLGTVASSAWAAFARSGDPNTAGLPKWPRYTAATRATMMFDVNSRVVNDPNAGVRQILQS